MCKLPIKLVGASIALWNFTNLCVALPSGRGRVGAGTDWGGRCALAAPAMVIAASFFGGGTPASAQQSIGGAETVVNQVRGNLTAGRVVAVLRGDDVYRDEGVRTGADSTAKLVLRDKTVLSVGPSSSVKLDRFVYAGEGQEGAIAVNLMKGALVFATGNAAKHSYLITTPTAALGVRGTIFRIDATASKTLVTLQEGAMDVCMRSHKQRCVYLDHPGQQATVTTTQVAVTEDPHSPAVGAVIGNVRGAPGPATAAPASAPGPSGGTSASAPGAAAAATASAPGSSGGATASAPGSAAAATASAPGSSGGATASAPGPSGPGPGGPGPSGNGNGQGNGNGNGVGEGGNNGHGHNGGGQGNGNSGGQGNGHGGGGGSSGH